MGQKFLGVLMNFLDIMMRQIHLILALIKNGLPCLKQKNEMILLLILILMPS